MNPFIASHPLIQHKVTRLRDKNTGTKEFRELVREITQLLCYEVTRGLPLSEIEVETPIQAAKANVIATDRLIFVPILRAGLGMVEGAASLLPFARIGHIGLYRNEETLQPVEYYCKLPDHIDRCDVILLDPMLATGGSAADAIARIKLRSPLSIRFMCIIAAPEGLARIEKEHPDIQVYCAALDNRLNEHGYIVPGLGDAGDRFFGTN